MSLGSRLRPLEACRLYTFVDMAYVRWEEVEKVAEALCCGGADVIQLRAKDYDATATEALAKRLSPITERHRVWLVVNDHPDVALRIGAPLCHLGQEDFFDSGRLHVRELAGPSGQLGFGLSSHAPTQAERAVRAGACYLGVGPVFATPTKPGRPPVTLDYVRWAATHLDLPWFAIGGITRETLTSVLEAGARRVCVVSDILTARDIASACQWFAERLRSWPDPRG